MEDIRLLVTDLDGTLIGSVDEFPLYTVFRERLQAWRRETGILWVVCSGRSYRSFLDFFSPMKAMGLVPDMVIVRHAYIYTRTRFGYLPHLLWNLRILLLLWLDRLRARTAVAEWHALMTRAAHGVRTIRRRRDRLWLRFATDESAAFAAKELQRLVAPHRHFRVFRYRREVDVRSIPFTKGMAVNELSRHLGIARDHVLAIGNGHNDISLLNRNVARFTGCPANAEPDVVQAVHEAGGHIAEGRSLSGVIEILDAVAQQRVRSDLPVWWEDPARGDNPWPQGKSAAGRSRQRTRGIILAAGAAYTVLLVFSQYGLVPGHRFFLAPFERLLSLGERVLLRLFELGSRIAGFGG